MLLAALWMTAALASPSSPATTFAFQGQPACVEVSWKGDRTELVNRCEVPLLVDQSVYLWKKERPLGIIPPDTTVQLRDLSWFTVGMSGELYKVVAVVAETPEDPPLADSPPGAGVEASDTAE